MAEALPSTSSSSYEKNITMLLEKLNEFRMSTDHSVHRSVYSKVESKLHELF